MNAHPTGTPMLDRAFEDVAAMAVAPQRYYRTLIAEGVEPQTALSLTVEYQKVLSSLHRSEDGQA